MAPDERRAVEPATFAGRVLDRYRHVCAFVNEQSEMDAVLDPFIRQGIDGGDRLLYLVDPAESAVPVNRLRRLGYDAGALLEHHQAEVRTSTETFIDILRTHPMVQISGVLQENPFFVPPSEFLQERGLQADR